MKHARFLHQGRVICATLDGDSLVCEADGTRYPLSDITQWLPPIQPNNMIAAAINYSDHASELGFAKPQEPVLFHKVNTCLLGHMGVVRYPAGAQYMHYENELLVVIGKAGRDIRPADAMDHVLGYTIGNDITVRDYLLPYYRPPLKVKNHDTFGPMGPYLVDKDDLPDPHNLTIRTYVNNELRQTGSTRDLIFNVPDLICFISSFMTLSPGDVIWTGTPEGISPVHPGDVMRLEIEGLGVLENYISDGSSTDTTKEAYQ